MQEIDFDVICLQETKATVAQVKMALEQLQGYHIYANEAAKKGYSGTAILSKELQLMVSYGIGIEEHDKEGRVVCEEYSDFYLVNVYVPN